MLQKLTNLPDNELMARARKLKDEEAAGILLERYSHLLAAVSLPSLNSYGNTPDDFFPSLLRRLFYSLQTQTIPKLGEWMQFFIKSQGNRTTKNTFFFPSSASSDITRLEYKVEKANTNLLQKQQLTSTMNAAFDQLDEADRDLLNEFYIEQKTFAEIAAEQGYTIEEVRTMVKNAKQELASLALANLETVKVRQEKPTAEIAPAQIVTPVYARSAKREKESDQGGATLEIQEEAIHPGRARSARRKKETIQEGAVVEIQKGVINPAPARSTRRKKEPVQKHATLEIQEQAVNVTPVRSTKRKKESNQGRALLEIQEQHTDVEYTTPENQEAMTQGYEKLGKRTLHRNLGYIKIEKQEQVITPGYAKFGQQGQDIKDLQQGSLF
jgi:predicted RNase H-like HicB family nuclease